MRHVYAERKVLLGLFVILALLISLAPAPGAARALGLVASPTPGGPPVANGVTVDSALVLPNTSLNTDVWVRRYSGTGIGTADIHVTYDPMPRRFS